MASTNPAPAGSGTARYPNGGVVPTNPPSWARWRCPSWDRSRMRSRSNSANTLSSCSINRPAGVRVSIPSVADNTRTPRASIFSSSSSRCSRLRPSRSSFATSSTSMSPAVAAASSSSNAGRDEAAPDTPASTYSPTGVNPCRVARSAQWARWVSIEVPSICPSVETRRYTAARTRRESASCSGPASPADAPERDRGATPTSSDARPGKTTPAPATRKVLPTRKRRI